MDKANKGTMCSSNKTKEWQNHLLSHRMLLQFLRNPSQSDKVKLDQLTMSQIERKEDTLHLQPKETKIKTYQQLDRKRTLLQTSLVTLKRSVVILRKRFNQ